MITLDPATLDRFSQTASKPRPLDEASVRLLHRLKLLNENDRLLVELYLRHGMSRRQIGRTLGHPSGTITRRLRAILARLNDPLIHALISDQCSLSPQDRQMGIERFLQRMTLRQLAQRHELNCDQVRSRLDYIRGWFCGQRPASR